MGGSGDTRAVWQSEAILRVMIQEIPDAIFVKDLNGRYRLINEAGARMLGKTIDAVIGRTDLELFSPDTANKIINDDRDVIRVGRSVHTEETEYVEGRARVFSSTKSPLRDMEGRVIGVIGLSRDITEAKRRAQEEMEALSREAMQERLNFRALIENSPDVTARFDRSLRHLFVNRAVVEATGIPAEKWIGKTHRELGLPDEFCRIWEESLPKAFAGTEHKIEFQFTTPSGLRYFQVRLVPERAVNGRTETVLAIARDITGHVLATERLRREKEVSEALTQEIRELNADLEKKVAERTTELRKAVQVRDEFISIASHELKTPLTPLNIQIQNLNRLAHRGKLASLPPERLSSMLESSVKQLRSVTQLIEDLLDVSRITSGKLALERGPVDLVEIAREVIDAFAPESERSGSRVELVASGPVIGNWDRGRLEQVIVNLVSNAFKYGEGRPIRVMVEDRGDWASLAVRDLGIGIPRESLPRIFNRFERAVSQYSFGGLGLGLYISREIVSQHGGNIEVESEPGHGSTFTVQLPKRSKAARIAGRGAA